MASGLMQLVAYGSQDLYLTGNPQITFFKVVYRRHTNFSMEAVNVEFNDSTGFGRTSSLVIPKNGDLIYNTYLQISIPSISLKRSLDSSNINTLTDDVNKCQNNYDNVLTFLSYNYAAYRAAYNIYLSDTVVYSNEIWDAIVSELSSYVDKLDTSFKSMITDDFNKEYPYIPQNGGVSYRYTPISGNLGNICLNSLNEYWNVLFGKSHTEANTIPKEITMKLINFLLENCKMLDAKYYSQLITAKTALADANNDNYKFAWVTKLGHSIIDYIEFSIGGNVIDKQYGQFIDIWHQLMGKMLQEQEYLKMIGHVKSLITFDRTTKPSYTMKIPLQFFFNRFSGLALPLIALQYNDVSFKVKFRSFSECAYVDPDYNIGSMNDLLENLDIDMSASMLFEYVYLDSCERRKFAQSSHEYLITQTQVNSVDYVSATKYQFDLDLQHPTLCLIWTIQRTSLLSNPDCHTKCYWNTYTTVPYNDINPIISSELTFSGQERASGSSNYFNYLQPLYHCKNTPAAGINCYFFSLFPFEHQPSGSCNMSRIPKVRLSLEIDPFYYDNDETFTLTVYAVNYNILRIIGGMGNTAYIV